MKQAILFDLDGTLLDTAADLISALNEILLKHGCMPQEFTKMRCYAGYGSESLICHGFNIDKADPKFATYRKEFLTSYQSKMTTETTFFTGMPEVLQQLDDLEIPWGIVTNKPSWLTEPLLEHFGLIKRSRCVISGDTLPKRKPEPEPLWHACEIINMAPEVVSYVGDNEFDLQAAKAAGLYAIAALYGYGLPSLTLNLADYVIQSPLQILTWINKNSL